MAEKSVQEIPRPLREQFERGMAAYHKSNWDYALTLFTAVLQKEPGFFECREALRAAQFRKPGTGGGLFRKLLGQASPQLAKAQLALRSSPAEALHAAELVLNEDPRNYAAHELLARAAMTLALPRTAVLSLEIVFKASPSDRDVAVRLAKALVAAGQSDRADKIYADLLAVNPADSEVAQAYKNLGARRTLADKGYATLATGEGSYRDALRDLDQAVSLEQESRHVKADEIADRLLAEYEQRLAREPGNLKILRNIAELHAQQKNFDAALATFARLVDFEGRNDPSLAKVIADTRLAQFDHRLASLDPSAPDHAEAHARLQQERDAFEIEECRARVERFPTDLGIRFEFGQILFKLGKISEAIQELQKAQAHPHRRIAAIALLAKCFSRRGMNDLAARSLQTALKEKPVFDDEKKDLIYELGCVLEKMGKPADAIEHFKLIYEIDIAYRDVAARVDAFYANPPP